MALCEICKKRENCREMCLKLKRELSIRGVSPRQKDKTYSVDVFYLEENKNPFNEFQQEVARKLVRDNWKDLFSRLDFMEAMNKVLSPREKQIIQLVIEGYTQEEIGQKLKINHQRACFLFQRAKAKIKKVLGGG